MASAGVISSSWCLGHGLTRWIVESWNVSFHQPTVWGRLPFKHNQGGVAEMLRCLKLNGRFLRTEIEGGRCSTEGASEFPLQNTQSQVTLQMSTQVLLPVKHQFFELTISAILHYLVWRLRSLVVEAWNTALEVNVTQARALTWFHG